MSLLCVKDVSKNFQQLDKTIPVLANISITFNRGFSYALSGISGSGKSTLLQILSGFEKPTQGTVIFDDKNIHTFNAQEHEHFLHSSIGILFQTPHLIQELTVLENIMLKGFAAGLSRKDAIDRALILLNDVMLIHKAQQKPTMLSGGEQQRVALARALMNDPVFLLADEPTAHLDVYARDTILELLHRYKTTHHMGLIISSHDPYVTHTMDYHYVLEQGSLTQYEEPLNNKKCC